MAVNSEQESEVAFLSGFNADGTLAATAYHTWNHQEPPSYSGTSTEDKWGGTTAGTAGGTVTYSFAANITATQQAALLAGLQLWQDEANISFAQAPAGTTADFNFEKNDAGTSGYDAQFTPHPVGSTTISQPSADPQPHISIDMANAGFGTFEDNFSDAGLSFSVLVHEEGHMLGLGHSGPYNEGTGSDTAHATYQLTAYDSRQYSDMSYNRPNNPNGTLDTAGAKYDPSIDTANWGHDQAVTPMELDILAAQRLYGAPTGGALTQAQTFGFNCTITDATRTFFDFSNYAASAGAAPVLTLYDSASTGSTLDLSGYASASVVNLNQGAFSNVDGLTSNICIAYGTKIDTAIGGSGDDTFTVNSDNDTIDGGAGTNTVDFSGAMSGYAVASVGGTTSVTDLATGAVDTLSDVQTLDFSDGSVAVCYGAGTLVRTVRGDIAVEALAVGDMVVTATGAHRLIRWLGHRREAAQPEAVQPVRIPAHAFGQGRPFADLTVSPGHAICIDVAGEILVPALALVNGTSVRRLEAETVTYWHVELESHDVILANGLAAESYLDTGNRTFFAEGAVVALHAAPEAIPRNPAGFCRPFHASGPLVDAIRAKLDGRRNSARASRRAALSGARKRPEGLAQGAFRQPCGKAV